MGVCNSCIVSFGWSWRVPFGSWIYDLQRATRRAKWKAFNFKMKFKKCLWRQPGFSDFLIVEAKLKQTVIAAFRCWILAKTHFKKKTFYIRRRSLIILFKVFCVRRGPARLKLFAHFGYSSSAFNILEVFIGWNWRKLKFVKLVNCRTCRVFRTFITVHCNYSGMYFTTIGGKNNFF